MSSWFRRAAAASVARLARARNARSSYLVTLWLGGSSVLAIETWVCFVLGLPPSAVVCAYLVIILLLSLLGSFVSSVLFSVIAVGCFDYFSLEPTFTFGVADPRDLLALFAFVSTSFVVTGRVRRLRDMADAHREQARLLDLTHDSIFVRNADDVITFWNRGAEELYGWKREETAGRTTYDLLRTKCPVSLDEITAVLRSTGRWEGELLHTKRDGTQISVASRWSLQRDLNGRPVATLETNNDITERKRAEDALKRSQATYLAEAQKLSTTGSFGWNVATGELLWSEESFRIFGYDPTLKPTVEAVFQRVHPDDVALVQRVTDRAAREKLEIDFEHRLLMPDGSVKHLHVVARIATDEPGDLQFVGAVMDVTSAKQAQEQLHQAQAELAYITRMTTLGELAASIAHEVNQPLTAIVTSGDAGLRFLGRDPPRLDEVRDALIRMIGDGKRASGIIQRIRALTKRTETQSAPVDLNSVISESVALVQREVSSHRVALHIQLTPRLPSVLGDGVQLQQVMINLIINGIQAMASVDDRSSELTIRSRGDETGKVLVSVQDSGVGIDPENVNRLFDAFFTTKPDGMGMGLSICRTIIEAHGGKLWASSNAGPGATFQFSLPAIHEPVLAEDMRADTHSGST
jgi:PAS domain S-box-containing protein